MSDTNTEIVDGCRHVRHMFDNGLGVHLIYHNDAPTPYPESFSEDSRKACDEALCMAAPMVDVGPAWMTVDDAAVLIKDEAQLQQLLDGTEHHEVLGLDTSNPMATMLRVKLVSMKIGQMRAAGLTHQQILASIHAEHDAAQTHNDHTIH